MHGVPGRLAMGQAVKALILTDLHAHMNFPFARMSEHGLPDRFLDLLDIFTQVERLIIANRVDVLFLGGDITHRRHAIPFRLYNALQGAIARVTKQVRHTVMLVGNHDYEDAVTHSLVPFQYWRNVTVVDTPQVVKMQQDWFMLPYLHDAEAVTRAVEQAPSDLPFLGHYATEGVPLEQDYWLPSPLKLGEMGKFSRAFFGHIHKPSELMDRRVVNVGAPMHFDFGDTGDRYAVLVDGPYYLRIPLAFPRFVTAKYPRLPMPPPYSGYLRVQGVTAAAAQDVRTQALRMGWRDCVTDLVAHVAKRCPELNEAEQAELVDVGERFLGS